MSLLKKLWMVLVVTLALNFVALAAVAGLLAQRAHLDTEKIRAVREVLFPADESTDEGEPDPIVEEPAGPTPMEELLALLDEQSGKRAERRVSDLTATLDERATMLDRRRREVLDRRRTVDAAARSVRVEREAFESDRDAWDDAVRVAGERASDEGFQEALALYEQLPSKQVKAIFAELADEEAVAYLRAMEPRQATKVLKEFKTDAEIRRATALLEMLRDKPVPEPDGNT